LRALYLGQVTVLWLFMNNLYSSRMVATERKIQINKQQTIHTQQTLCTVITSDKNGKKVLSKLSYLVITF